MITDCHEIWIGRAASDDITTALEDTRVFRIQTDNAYDSAEDIKQVGVLPRIRSPHPKNSRLWCSDRRFQQEQALPTVWMVTCQYKSHLQLHGGIASSGGSSGGSPNQEQENPLLRAPEISFSTTKFTEELEFDFGLTKKLIANSAGEAFYPPLSRQRGRMTMTYVRNIPRYNPRLYEPLIGATNIDLFIDFFDAHELLLDDHTANDHFDAACGIYWTMTNKFMIRFISTDYPMGWLETKIVDKGFREKKDGKLVNIQDHSVGGRLTRPANLDGHGRELAPGFAAVTEWTGGSPFRLVQRKDFSVLQ